MFHQFGLDSSLERGIQALGFTTPTPIQQAAIPPAMAGRDVLACAMTGTGKTAAFLVPMLHRLAARRAGSTRALVLTPTRELATQIDDHLRQLAAHTRIRSAAVVGGVSLAPQRRAFERGVDVLIATPGRLLDHLQHPYARLGGIEILVLDEADRMLDMGFLPDIRRILQHLPPRRQTLLFSATMPAESLVPMRKLLNDPITVDLQRKATAATGITHSIYPVTQQLKTRLLVALLTRDEVRNALVFTRTKHRADRLAQVLGRHGISSALLHGNRSQAQRAHALAAFKARHARVLVATDIAARGIDIEELSHVINYDVPAVPETYIHRVGRTARAAATGDALTLVAPGEEAEVQRLERAIGKRLTRLTLPGFDYTAGPAGDFSVLNGGRSGCGSSPARRKKEGA
jgi:ATP-dependent RNA helicase RhlE